MSDKSPTKQKVPPQKIIQVIRKIIIDDGITDETSTKFKDEFKKGTTLSTFHQQSYQEIINDFKNDAKTIKELRDENEKLKRQLEQKERRIQKLDNDNVRFKDLNKALNKDNTTLIEEVNSLTKTLENLIKSTNIIENLIKSLISFNIDHFK